ncbi:hypothetical protein Pmani_029378 [Petrolisthes manimaculis]|uniref:Zinc finger ZPR1-type domain-containing protein n=1 Tax=Petrolisthes manimaculis TaxID=1843537 RepID=A0AAE1NZV1_9EUCA|nr:hypothetical protein Pmani_029378 [Petrolisthes manimaculis]
MGTTRLLMTRIPHYKEVILTSFECEDCGNRNSGCQTGRVGEKGVRYRLEVRETHDLARQVVRSEHATVNIPELELEIPPTSEKGEVTTVEGLLHQTQEGLTRDQEARRHLQPQVAQQIDTFLHRLTACVTLQEHFTVIVDDPSGNSFVENPAVPQKDPRLMVNTYQRTHQQNHTLGLAEEEVEVVEEVIEEEEEGEGEKEEKEGEERIPEEEAKGEERIREEEETKVKEKGGRVKEEEASVKEDVKKEEVRVMEDEASVKEEGASVKEEERRGKEEEASVKEEEASVKEEERRGKEDEASVKEEETSMKEEETSVKDDVKDEGGLVKDEVLVFPTVCDRCSRPANTNMKVIQIPYFKEVIIMALHCDECGHRTNEVKSGAGVGDKGRRITLTITHPQSDLTRDVLKSDTCELAIPELELCVGGGLIGGKFTTVEGLLKDVRDDLAGNPFLAGDSAQHQRKQVLDTLLHNLDKVIMGERLVSLTLDDPAGNSYVQNLYAPDPDPNLTTDEYTRTEEQNDDLGLTHMNTEDYLKEEVEEEG